MNSGPTSSKWNWVLPIQSSPGDKLWDTVSSLWLYFPKTFVFLQTQWISIKIGPALHYRSQELVFYFHRNRAWGVIYSRRWCAVTGMNQHYLAPGRKYEVISSAFKRIQPATGIKDFICERRTPARSRNSSAAWCFLSSGSQSPEVSWGVGGAAMF